MSVVEALSKARNRSEYLVSSHLYSSFPMIGKGSLNMWLKIIVYHRLMQV